MIYVIKDDITRLATDAIVNAAKNSLLGGGGVDGEIHKAAGEQLLQECRTLNGCNTGEAKITKGYKLNAKNVIHTVAPIWLEKYNTQPQPAIEMLENCYKNSLRIAEENELKSIAFPCIGTGAYSFPNYLAAEIAVDTINEFLKTSKFLKEVTICCFTDMDQMIYKNKLQREAKK